MTAEFQDEVDGLTLGQCLDHPKWDAAWTVEEYSGQYSVYDRNAGAFHFIRQSPAKSARDALKTLLPERPPKVVVTEDDREFAKKLAHTYGDGIKPWWEVVVELIAAYRVQHSGGAS